MAALAVSAVSCGGRGGYSSGCCPSTCCAPAQGYCEGPQRCTACTDGIVKVDRCSPTDVVRGRDFTVTLTATANARCTDTIIKETMPEGLTYVSSDPIAKVDGKELSWDIGHLECGECKRLCITYRACEEGCYTNCYTVCACPCCCQSVYVGCPKLTICKCGPECVRLGCPVRYSIYVKNEGSSVARDVSLVDYVPPELQHRSCCDTLSWCLGDMACGDCRRIDVDFCTIKCGITTNTATATSCGCPPVTATATTHIQDCCLTVTKTGPEGPVVVGKNADYRITVTNNGNVPLKNVKVIDTGASGTRIKSAPGAEVAGNQATWIIPSFPPGETLTFDVTMTSCVHGCLPNKVCAMCDQECGDCACVCTEWLGVPGIWLTMKDSVDPVCVDMCTDYTICVQNQGFADDTNVKVTASLGTELKIMSISSPVNYTQSGNKVTFDAIPILRAGQCATFVIKAQAKKPGDARVKVQAISDMLSSPVSIEESTQVY